MKITGFLAIGFFAIMAIAVGFVYFGDTETMTPQISDDVVPTDSVRINPNPDSDTIDIVESVDVEINDGEITDGNYWTDENGKKHYTIEAHDSPILQD
jgi:hypothetical protein